MAPAAALVSNSPLQIQQFLTHLLTSPRDVVIADKTSYDRAIAIFPPRRGVSGQRHVRIEYLKPVEILNL